RVGLRGVERLQVAEGDAGVLGRRPHQRGVEHAGVAAVGVLVADGVAVGIDEVDPAGRVAVEVADAEAQLVLDDRAADGDAAFVGLATLVDVGDFAAGIGRVAGQAGGGGDVADGAAFRTAAEQRA